VCLCIVLSQVGVSSELHEVAAAAAAAAVDDDDDDDDDYDEL